MVSLTEMHAYVHQKQVQADFVLLLYTSAHFSQDPPPAKKLQLALLR